MQKRCGRCEVSFECRVEEVSACACSELDLAPATQRFLQKTKYDCLCPACLAAVNELVIKANTLPFPRTGADFEEGTHYYLDQGCWVMTELYLLQRGYCCGNGCRHCAYGYQPI